MKAQSIHPIQEHAKLRRVIGLTGGMGMGKTTVSNYLATAYQLPILDADLYAREAVIPGSPVLQAIVDRYGSGILTADGSLNRCSLGNIVFNSPSERLWLEQQIHPYVRDRFVEEIAQRSSSETIVLVAPLLFEARMTDLVTEIWVVYCSALQQIERLSRRDRGLNLEQIQIRVDSQMAIERKLACADLSLDNSSNIEHLLSQVDQALAQERSGRIGTGNCDG